MILIDMNQIVLANINQQAQINKDQITESYIRTLALNLIKNVNVKFRDSYGELVICLDSPPYWRKNFFPFYKQKNVDNYLHNWWDSINKINEEISLTFPYKCIKVESCEADDVIATLAVSFQSPNIIISGDMDFLQLQKYSWIQQYSPVTRKFVKAKNPIEELFKKIVYGDKNDGIPNFLSDDDSLVTQKRQKRLSTKKIDEILQKFVTNEFFEESKYPGFVRNSILIDYSKIPSYHSSRIIKTFLNEDKDHTRFIETIYQYLIENKLKTLTNSLGDFINDQKV